MKKSLAQKAKDGCEESFGYLIKSRGEKLFKIAMCYVKNEEVALDIVSEATLDDSKIKVAIELNENIKFKITEYNEPGTIQISYEGVNAMESKKGYFVRTNELSYGEELAQIE